MCGRRSSHISRYPDGQTTPTPDAIDCVSGELLDDVTGELGLRRFIEAADHTFVVTSDKEGADSELVADADVVISQQFWPACITRERMEKAPKLKLCLTAGIGSDHVDLEAAIERGITVVEVTFCNSISVAEHAVMMILSLGPDYITQHDIARSGGWDIAGVVSRSYDPEGMQVGVVAAGRIGLAVLRRMKPFDVGLHYFDFHPCPKRSRTN